MSREPLGESTLVFTAAFIKRRMEAVQTDDTAVTVHDFLLLFFLDYICLLSPLSTVCPCSV